MRFKGDIMITDPCYLTKCDEDWQSCKWGEDMSVLGFNEYMYISSGDEYACVVVNSDTNEKLGEFCTDSGVLVIIYMDDLLKYDPEATFYNDWPNTNTIIRQFDGEIQTIITEDEFNIIGKGNINFNTIED